MKWENRDRAEVEIAESKTNSGKVRDKRNKKEKKEKEKQEKERKKNKEGKGQQPPREDYGGHQCQKGCCSS